MITFENGMDIRSREPKRPEVAKFRVREGGEYRYCVIGTAYEHLRTTAGDVRTWKSYSGAWKAAKRYIPL